ncbi:hypothetical protein GCM10023107_15510 [Actinoplanes octamycinicus]|nr:hypothetical protein Aoc01nite_19440 [Actinoplanes octamycinicus]
MARRGAAPQPGRFALSTPSTSSSQTGRIRAVVAEGEAAAGSGRSVVKVAVGSELGVVKVAVGSELGVVKLAVGSGLGVVEVAGGMRLPGGADAAGDGEPGQGGPDGGELFRADGVGPRA